MRYVGLVMLLASVAHADISAVAPAPQRCGPLRFSPIPGVRYVVSTWETPGRDPKAAYHSALELYPRSPSGWYAREAEFRRPFVSDKGLYEALLEWRLDERGVPVDEPDAKGHGDPLVVRNLSLFAFRPVGLIADSACVGSAAKSTFVDAAGRTRSYTATIAASDGKTATLTLEGSVAVPGAATWRQRGQLQISLDDGLAGEAQIHESGPRSERDRTIVVTRTTRRGEWRILVSKDGAFFIGDLPTDLATLRAKVRAAVAVEPDLRVFIAGDKAVPHEKIVQLMDVLKAEGVRKVGLLVAP